MEIFKFMKMKNNNYLFNYKMKFLLIYFLNIKEIHLLI